MKILAFTLALLTATAVLLSCADLTASPAASSDGTTAATTTAVTTLDRDTLTKPNLTPEREALLRSVWAAVKNTVDKDLTINNLSVASFYVKCGDAYVCFYRGCKKDNTIIDLMMMCKDTVGDYEFRYTNLTKLSVFENGGYYTLSGAYAAGVLTDEELKTVWEAYKAEYPGRYESDSWDDEEETEEAEDAEQGS